MSRQSLSSLLLAIAMLLGVLGLVTLLPHQGTLQSDLGYYTLCPFAPWSTLTLLVLGGLCWMVHRHIDSLPTDQPRD